MYHLSPSYDHGKDLILHGHGLRDPASDREEVVTPLMLDGTNRILL